jgi:hypothetical protein
VIEIGPKAVGQAAGFDFALANANDVRSALPFQLDLRFSSRQSE